jgi:hypothetical protein
LKKSGNQPVIKSVLETGKTVNLIWKSGGPNKTVLTRFSFKK